MITVRNLQKKYGDLLVLKGINAEIKKGEIISVIGPSGTGKSTFLRCLNLPEIPDEGEILIDGISLLEKGVNAHYFPSFEEIEKFLSENCVNGDLLITMGAGNVVEIGEDLLKK